MIDSLNAISQNPLINIPFFVGLIFLAAGIITWSFPPKKINSLYGYRSTSSMKSQERWTFAQEYSSKEMIKLGLLLFICGFLGLITNFNDSVNLALGLGLMFLILTVLIWRVEKAIKSKFNGN